MTRQKAETVQAEIVSTEGYHEMVEHVVDGIYIVDQQLNVLDVNTQGAEMLGYTKKEFIGLNVLKDIIVSESFEETPSHLTAILEDKPVTIERQSYHKDGTIIPIEVKCRMLPDGNIQTIVRDITDLRQAEAALREMEVTLHTVVNSLPFDFFVLDMDGRYSMQNAYTRAGWGDIIGKSPPDICPDAGLLAIWEENNRRVLDGEIIREDVCYHRNDAERHAHNIVSPIYDGEGIRGICGINIDITAHKQAENALRESEERYRRTLDNMLEGVLIIGFDWRYLYINEVCAEHARRAKQELFGNTMMEMYPGIEDTDAFAHLRRCMEERVSHLMENKFTYPDGVIRWFLISIHPVLEGLFILSIDITARKQTEKAIMESEIKFRTLAEQSPNMIFINKGGRVVYVNKACVEVMGYTKEELYAPDFDFLVLIAPESIELVKSTYDEQVQRKEIRTYECSILTKDGKRLEVIINSNLMDYEGERAILGIITDITESKQTQMRLTAANKRLKELVMELRETQASLATSEAMYRELVEDINDTVYACDADGNITYLSPIIEQMTGYRPEDIIGRHSTDRCCDN